MSGGKYGGDEMGEESGVEKGSSRRTGASSCLPKTQTIMVIQIKSDKIREKVELWKEKALTEKIVGIWTRERDLISWIKSN